MPRAARARCRCSTARAVDYAITRGARARLHDPRDVDLRAQELLLSRTCRRAIRSRSTSGRSRPAARVDVAGGGPPRPRRHHAHPPGRGRRQVAARGVSPTPIASSYVDFNRSGVPLIEIVTEPDLRSAADAAAFFEPPARASSSRSASTTATWRRAACAATPTSRCGPAGADDARHEGRGQEPQLVPLPRRRRSSTRSSGRSTCSSDGGRVVQETRLWDAAAGRTVSMRSKEEAHDYRYFPEPDLPPLVVDAGAGRRDPRRRCPSCPTRGAGGSSPTYGLPDYDAAQLTQSRGARRLLRGDRRAPARHAEGGEQLDHGRAARDAERARRRRSTRVAGRRPSALAGLIALVEQGTISGVDRQGRVREDVRHRAARPTTIVARRGAGADRRRVAARRARSRDVLAAERRRRRAVPRRARPTTFGFLVGQVMKAAGGKANPKRVNELLKQRAAERDTAAVVILQVRSLT